MSNASNISKLKDILVYMLFTIGLILVFNFFSEFGSDFELQIILKHTACTNFVHCFPCCSSKKHARGTW